MQNFAEEVNNQVLENTDTDTDINDNTDTEVSEQNQETSKNNISNDNNQAEFSRLAYEKRKEKREKKLLEERLNTQAQELQELKNILARQGNPVQVDNSKKSDLEILNEFVKKVTLDTISETEIEHQKRLEKEQEKQNKYLGQKYLQNLEYQIEEAREKKYPDLPDLDDINIHQNIKGYLLGMDNPEDILYKLSKDDSLLNKINNLDAVQQLKTIVKLSEKLRNDNKKISNAPPPTGIKKTNYNNNTSENMGDIRSIKERLKQKMAAR